MRPPAEFAVLLDASASATPADLPSDLDWSRLGELAVRHGVQALLHRFLSGAGSASIPAGFLRELKSACQAQNLLTLRLTALLAELVGELERVEIPVLAYKGPAIAMSTYGSLALRPFCDLDLLVHPRELDRARAALRAYGCEEFPRLTAAQLRSFFRTECECWYSAPDRRSSIELHWAVRERLYSFPLDLDGVFARSQTIELGGRAVRTMAAEDLLLTLSVHGAKHGWSRLKWVVDVDRILSTQPDLDWEALFAAACKLRARRLLLLGLAVSGELLGTVLPQRVRDELQRDPAVLPLAREVAESLWSPVGKLAETAVYLRAREDVRDRLRYCVETLFTPTLAEWEARALPDVLFPLYYLYRPLRLALNYSQRGAASHGDA